MTLLLFPTKMKTNLISKAVLPAILIRHHRWLSLFSRPKRIQTLIRSRSIWRNSVAVARACGHTDKCGGRPGRRIQSSRGRMKTNLISKTVLPAILIRHHRWLSFFSRPRWKQTLFRKPSYLPSWYVIIDDSPSFSDISSVFGSVWVSSSCFAGGSFVPSATSCSSVGFSFQRIHLAQVL